MSTITAPSLYNPCQDKIGTNVHARQTFEKKHSTKCGIGPFWLFWAILDVVVSSGCIPPFWALGVILLRPTFQPSLSLS